MMVPHARLFSWIGLCAALVGMWLLYNPPEEDLLPINQVLLALDATLSVIWVFVAVVRGRA